jgi:hypothetical protein
MVYQGRGCIKNKKLTETDRPALHFAKPPANPILPGALSRSRIVVLVTAGKGKYDLRIVQSIKRKEIVSVILRRIHR